MAKKRQQDFTRVQLKPGRPIGRRATNITQIKFKSRKIVMPKEKVFKPKAEFTLADYIRMIQKAGSDKDRAFQLNVFHKVIPSHLDTLPDYMRLIFGVVFDYLNEQDEDVSSAALEVITAVVEHTEDSHLHRYSEKICKTITAILKNPIQKLVPVALKLLSTMLKNHPTLVCHDMTLLYALLPTERKHHTRYKVINEREKFQYSGKDDIDAFGYVSDFLKNVLLLKDKNDLPKEDEDKVVRMDAKITMSLVLYTGGGQHPVDIEEAYATQCNPQMDPFEEDAQLIAYIDQLLKYIPNYFCQIISMEASAEDNALRAEPIKDLSILIQLLCNVAELAERLHHYNAAEEVAAFLSEAVFSSHRKRFPFEILSFLADVQSLPLALLNVILCYLHMKFLSSDDIHDGDGELIELYIKKFFLSEKVFSADMKCQCIPYFIKMIQLYEYKTDIPKVIPFLLDNLITFLRSTRVNHPNKKVLLKFLFDMCLLPGYKFWIETSPMQNWYDWLTGHLRDFSKLDKSIMKMIVKIAKLRHPSFIKHLDFNIVKPILTRRNDNMREIAIFLLHNMDMTKELLKSVYDVLCLDSFPKKFAIRLIHMLNVRFYQYPANKRPYVDYIEFLLNIAIDTFNFSRRVMNNIEANDYTKAVKVIQDRHSFCIIPSLHWKEHSKLFEVCARYLKNLPFAPVSVMNMRLVKELLDSATLIPMHCALGILKLDKPELNEKSYRSLMRNLNFSCLFTTSVLSQILKDDDEWYKWNVHELMKSMALTTNTMIHTLKLIEEGNFAKQPPDALFVYHFCRILKFFIERNILDYDRREIVHLALQSLAKLVEVHCSDKSIKHQPMFEQIYAFLFRHFHNE